jgi:hypothetical protein
MSLALLNGLLVAVELGGVIALIIVGLVLRHWLPGYLEEKGKHLATKEDFDGLLEQLKKTTVTTEEIKAQIERGTHTFKERLAWKKDLHFNIVEALHDAKLLILRDQEHRLQQERSESPIAEYYSRLRSEELERLSSILDRLERARGIAPLVLRSECSAVLDRCLEAIADARRNLSGEERVGRIGRLISETLSKMYSLWRSDPDVGSSE